MKKGILIVTNNLEFRNLMETFLSRSFDVKMCGNGRDAINMVENGYLPSLIICESSMLLTEGRTSIIRIKENTDYQHIPVLVLSEKERCFSGKSTYGFLTKPFSLKDLETRIKNLLKVEAEKIEMC
jgi:DNA-binding response OmpR family regulator